MKKITYIIILLLGQSCYCQVMMSGKVNIKIPSESIHVAEQHISCYRGFHNSISKCYFIQCDSDSQIISMEIGLGLSRSSIANNEILILLPFIDNNNFNVMAIKLRFENVYKNTGNIEFNTTPIRLEKGTYYYKLDYGQADENKDTDIFETTLLPY